MNYKQDFPVLASSDIIYLDSAASAQKPRQVINTIERFYRAQYAPVHRGLYTLAVHATEQYENARKKVAQFINAKPDEIIFTKGTTASLNGLANSIHALIPSSKKKIILTQFEHHANIIPWQQFAKKHGFVLDYIHITKDFDLDYEEATRKLTSDVALLCMTHLSNVTGTLIDIEKLCKLAKQQNILTIVDGAQAIAHEIVNVTKINCDFYTFSGHKLYGPTGIGVLYGRRELLAQLPPFEFGGHMIETVTEQTASWASVPTRFEAGTPPIAQAIGLANAIDYVEQIGMDVIKKHESELTQYALAELKKLPNIQIKTHAQTNGIIAFTHTQIHPHDLASLLSDKKICIRAGHHCAMPLSSALGITASARMSFGIYNTTQDIDACIAAIKDAQRLFGEK
jgi:cysteine desulfurase/selenocysteine lyase